MAGPGCEPLWVHVREDTVEEVGKGELREEGGVLERHSRLALTCDICHGVITRRMAINSSAQG